MKKFAVFLLILLLTGCRSELEILPDTIVDIPLDPTESATAEAAEKTQIITAAATDAPTEPTTEEATKKPAKNSGSSGSKNNASSQGSSGSKNTSSAKPTEKPTAKPTVPATDPPTSQPATEAESEAPTRPSVSSYNPTSLDRSAADAINARRSEAELSALSLDGRLCTAAAQRARELSVSWSHTRPDGSHYSTVLAEFSCGYSQARENLYYTAGSANAKTIVEKWISSDDHREILLSPNAAAMGIASFQCDGITYCVVLIAQ